ncbi:DUF2281 domain-containing protein [Thermoflexus hugenholtzii]
MKTLEEMIRELPPELRQEVEDFVEFLLQKRAKRSLEPLRLEWKGALQDVRAHFTAVELQHKAQEWWGD